MLIIFENTDALRMSDKELFEMNKRLRKKNYIFIQVSLVLLIAMFLLGVFMLFFKWLWLFLISGVYLTGAWITLKKFPNKFRNILLKMPNCQFEDEYFYVGERQFKYSDVEVFEMGGDFARIKMGKYKLPLIFKDRDKGEIQMLVLKFKANAKRYKEV